MEEIKIVDNFMNEFEFRNYVYTMFHKHNFHPIVLDDVRLTDDDEKNDNDLMVTKDSIKYTVQTYLNTKIGESQIEETAIDMEKEKVSHGIIVTNFYVNNDVKNMALRKNIKILDRAEFEEGIYN
jgi:hypothetical protein